MRALLVGVLLAAAASCDPPPPPPTEVGDPCSGDERCDKGFVCLDAGDGNGTCQNFPDGCDVDDGCDCEGIEDLCPEEAIGKFCLSFGTRVEVECDLPEAGEGEGEGEEP